ncbi:MAG: hypothetical protein ACE145_15115 [Terriglobia bacterium]
MAHAESEIFNYYIDSQDRIIHVSSNWDAFALANDAADVCAAKILNRPLVFFLTGLETKHLYKLLLTKVRRSQKPLTLPFRCDGPAVRRYMELTMRPQADKGVEFQSRILREESRESVLLLDRGSSRSQDLLSICAWCKKVKVGSAWLEIEDAVAKLQLFHEPLLPRLTHGLCSVCQMRVANEAAAKA